VTEGSYPFLSLSLSALPSLPFFFQQSARLITDFVYRYPLQKLSISYTSTMCKKQESRVLKGRARVTPKQCAPILHASMKDGEIPLRTKNLT